jgi:hypothetical protein
MSEHVQEDPVEGRLQVPRRRVLRERGGGALPLRGRRLGAFRELHGHADDQRRALHRPLHPLRDVLLPRVHPEVGATGSRGRRDVTGGVRPDRCVYPPRG